MDIENLMDRYNNAIARIEREAEAQGIIVGNDIAQQIKKRVIETGEDAKGAAFTPYSDTQLPAFFYIGKSRTAAAEKRVQTKAKKKETLSYSDFRTTNNLNSDKKNFKFTGDMWRNFGVLGSRYENGIVTVEIGGQTPEAEKKIAVLSWQEGKNIADVADDEKAKALKGFTSWVQEIINEELRNG